MNPPPKFIKNDDGDMIDNPEYIEYLKKKALESEPPTEALAATKIEDGAEAAGGGLMDQVKDVVGDKKFLGGAGIGFLAGAATGAAVTHVVHKKKKKSKKKKRRGSSSSSSSSSSDSDY